MAENTLATKNYENMIAVMMKSNPKTNNDALTTVRVVARATPSGVGVLNQPSYRATIITAAPKTKLLIMSPINKPTIRQAITTTTATADNTLIHLLGSA